MQIRDRIKDFRRVRADALRPHPRNWRTHPRAQQDAVRGALAEIGYADALVARELPDGTLQLLDGHLRAELTPEALVPVLVLDVDEHEALKILATLDPLAALADADAQLLRGLLDDVHTESEALATALRALAAEHPLPRDLREQGVRDVVLPASFQVVVECEGEAQQRAVYEQMVGQGFKCRVLSL
ncbi:MAG: hypothetical protein DWQ37_01850 [Planctomycetota bacterium]|nr:MAG: hypothetical protein DWQ37_01850 [Planctomycetota bacterium]